MQSDNDRARTVGSLVCAEAAASVAANIKLARIIFISKTQTPPAALK